MQHRENSFGDAPAKRTSFTFELTPGQQQTLVSLLKDGNYRPVFVEHTIFAAEQPYCRINIYKSGKCLVQGREAEEFVAFVLEPLVFQAVKVGYEEVLAPDSIAPHMGVDESGKGDFFGPMVIACAYVDPKLAEAMKKMRVRDSKTITSDKVAIEMSNSLRKLLGERYAVVVIGPAAYNRLYSSMRSVNTILAWGHARAIENLLEKVPDCPRAISDQFGSKQQVINALMKRGKKIKLEQHHKAESDPAVAAASVLARGAFLKALKQMAITHGQPFPKGASEAVKEAAVELVRKNGPAILLETAKCHFKTADAVLAGAGSSRSALGAAGAAVSKPYKRFASKPAAPAAGSA